mgnify:CR=1 FL=1|tara:strand:- start:3779 stop:4804 length:1026 start_codon:yes stop_codon:yes gene_type:complete
MRQRETIIFFLPLSVEAFGLGNNTPKYSSTNDPSNAIPGESGSTYEVHWDARRMYINPQSINMREDKIIQKQLTKGGHMVQYWGEELITINAQGTTGSSGIEGINVLRDIYRHEQIQFRKILADRQREMAQAAEAAAKKAEEQMYEGNFGGFALGFADALTGGTFSKTGKGLANGIDILFGEDTFGEDTALGSNYGGSGATVKTIPTLAAFAVNIDMYYQGEFFKGYFKSFNVSESAQELGLFNYTFDFIVTRRTGKRDNFMPWHRNPLTPDGQTRVSQPISEPKGSWPGVEALSILPDRKKWNSAGTEYGPSDNSVESEINEEPETSVEPNTQPMDRRNI